MFNNIFSKSNKIPICILTDSQFTVGATIETALWQLQLQSRYSFKDRQCTYLPDNVSDKKLTLFVGSSFPNHSASKKIQLCWWNFGKMCGHLRFDISNNGKKETKRMAPWLLCLAYFDLFSTFHNSSVCIYFFVKNVYSQEALRSLKTM